jgi:hypothetical protein
MKSTIAMLVLVSVLSVFAGPPPYPPNQFNEVEAPVGRLGYRIGTYLTIEGIRAEEGKVGTHTLLVDKVGDYKFPKPIAIWVEAADLPKGERCVLKGYETGGWIGVPPQVLKETGQMPPQAVWQFNFVFKTTSVEQPKRPASKQ